MNTATKNTGRFYGSEVTGGCHSSEIERPAQRRELSGEVLEATTSDARAVADRCRRISAERGIRERGELLMFEREPEVFVENAVERATSLT